VTGLEEREKECHRGRKVRGKRTGRETKGRGQLLAERKGLVAGKKAKTKERERVLNPDSKTERGGSARHSQGHE